MSNENTSRATRYLPQVAVATTAVAVLPVLIVWLLLAERVISSPWVCVGLAIALSLTASILGSAYWKRRSGPGDMLFSELMLWGWLRRFQSERRLANAVGELSLDDTERTPSNETVELKGETLRRLAAALDAKDPYTDGHSRRVALHAAMVARKMGLSHEDVTEIRTAAAVHDVGKIRIPLEVLNKPAALTAAEFELVKRHADEGAEIVSRMKDPEISAMVRHHHERFDGTGYPAGLLGEQIPVGARIIAVADTFDALTSERPYRAAIPHKKALEIIGGVAGTQLDPVAVRAFIKCYSGKRAVLFWTLLAVSPQRAVALLSGRSSWRASLGSTATVAMPAALAALVAAAFGSAGNISRVRDQVHLAKSPSASYAPKAKQQSATTHHVAAAHAAKSPAPPSSPKFVKLVRKATRPRRLSRKPSAVSRHHRHRSHPIVRRSHHRRRHRPVKSVGTTPAQPPVSPGSPVGVPSASAPAPPEPTSKQDCMDGGWANFTGFSNQGLCIAWVEHNVLH